MVLIVFCLAIASGCAIIITADPVIYGFSKNGLKAINLKGWCLIFTVFLLVLLPIIQYKMQQTADNIKEIKQKEDWNDREASFKKSYEQNNQVITGFISEEMGEYRYKLDSVKNVLIKAIKDSVKTRISESNDPVLVIENHGDQNGIEMIKINRDTAIFRFFYTSADAGSSFFEIKSTIMGATILEKSMSNVRYCGQLTGFPYKSKIPKDAVRIVSIKIPNVSSFDLVYIWIKGKYKKIDGSKAYIIDDVYYYNMRGKTCGLITGNSRKNIIKCAMTFEK